MGSRYEDPSNQTDNTQQRGDTRQVQGNDRMQNEVYGNQGRDRVSQSQQMVAQELNGVLSHLQNAESTFEQRGVRAATGEYTAAIRAADSIDQTAVARERDSVRQQLQSQNLDAQTRRALVQEDADLHTLQRAPGFARANFALLMIRNGDQYYGTQLLLEAQQKDPEMNQDPNFQRHLKNAIDAAPRGQQQQPGDQQQQQQTQPGDTRTQQQVPGDQTQQPAQPGDQTQQQNQRVSPMDAQGRTPVESVQQMFGTVTGPGTMTPEVKQGFQQAIANADAGQSPKMQALLQAEAQAANAVRPLADANLVKAVTAQDQAAQQLIQQMTPDKQQAVFQLYNALDKSSTPQERQQIEQQLVAANPGLQQILQQRDQAMGTQNIQALMNYMTVENALQAEKNQAAITRFTYGLALQKNGDTEEAKKYVGDAVKLNNSTDPELKAYWQRTAASMGVPLDNTAPQTRPGDNTQPQTQGDQTRPTAGSAADALTAVEQKFQQVVAQKGDVKAAYQQLTPEFQAAQQKADAEFTTLAAQTTARDQQLQAAIDAKLTPQVKAQLQTLGTQIDAEKKNLTPDAQALWNKYQDPTTTDADRQTIHSQLEQKAPNMTKLGDQLEQAVGKDTLMNIATLAADHSKMQGALMGRFLTRYYMADAANTAGDTQSAQAQLGAAFQTVPKEFQAAFAQKPEVQALAQKVGIDLTKLPAPPDAVLAKAAGAPTGDQTQQPGATTDRTQTPGATTDQTQQPVAGVSPENQGLRPDQIIAKAQQSLQQNGMNDATKKQFGDAIKSADALYGPQDKQMTDQLINVLQTGKKADGSDLSPAERVQAHQLVQQEFQRATLGMQYRMAYGNVLNQNKQYATAEGVFKENIGVADKLPLASFQAELTQLGKDSQNPQIDRASQADLFTMMQGIQGSGTSKDDGLLYMPITARKQAALFYVAGADGQGNGLVKPEQASAMIDQATAKEKQLYGVTDDKLKAFDPTLANMAQGILPLMPEALRKQKQQADSFWSNALVDGGTAAAVLTLAGLTASVITKNPEMFGALVNTEGTVAKLSVAGYGVLGAGALGTEVLARHGVHQLVTGENESWTNSLIHGTAGLGTVGAMMLTRAKVSEFLYKGATVDAVTPRLAAELNLGAEATNADLAAAMLKQSSTNAAQWKALASSEAGAAPLMVDGVVSKEAAEVMSQYSKAQLGNLTAGVLKEGEGAIGKWYSPSGIAARAKGAFSPLDFGLENSNLAGQLASRSFASGYTTAFASVGTYSTITALDRPIDPATGKQMSYADSFIKSNYRSMSDNTVVDSLWLGILPAMKDGALAKSAFSEGAGPIGKTWGAIKAPFKISTFGSMGSELNATNYARAGLQAGQLGTLATLYNVPNLQKLLQGSMQSRAIGHQLDAMGAPITDQSAPKAGPTDTKVLNQQPAGQTDAPVTPPPTDNGAPIQDQPVDNSQQQPTGSLTQGTPGLGG